MDRRTFVLSSAAAAGLGVVVASKDDVDSALAQISSTMTPAEENKKWVDGHLKKHGGSLVAALFPFAAFFEDVEGGLFQPL